MPRALLIVLDSVGIGGAADAADYGDAGADTFGHIADACAAGRGDRPGLRQGPLALPNLAALGLDLAAEASTGRRPGLAAAGPLRGHWGYGVETSKGKDTPSGHWEIAGVPVAFDWGYFPDTHPAFPAALSEALIREGGLPGLLGDKHASGTAIVDELGAEHVRTGKPIVYTSVDSVLQIAAHEESFGLDRLYELCRVARRLCDPLRIGRVIARPFVGDAENGFTRTGNRKDYAIAAARRYAPRSPDAGRAADRDNRQDRRHLRPSGHRTRGQAARQRGLPDGGDRGDADDARRRLRLREPRRFRQRASATAATSPATPPASKPSTAASPRSTPS